MKRSNRYMVIALIGVAISAQNALGAWGIEELKMAQGIALETFRQNVGETAYNNIFGYSIEKNVQESAGKAKVTYKEAGVKKDVSYFCHEHGDGIDCH